MMQLGAMTWLLGSALAVLGAEVPGNMTGSQNPDFDADGSRLWFSSLRPASAAGGGCSTSWGPASTEMQSGHGLSLIHI
eukprot:2913461-Alexandrium_andersonii.AAC.1